MLHIAKESLLQDKLTNKMIMLKQKYLILISIFILATSVSKAQVITWEPQYPTIYDTVTIYYDATQGNGVLAGIETVYAHTGLLTSKSLNNNDWHHKIASWHDGDTILNMESLGSDMHKFKFYPKSFYNIHQSETVTDICYVFRDEDGTLAGKNADDSDIYVPLWTEDMQARFTAPMIFPLIPASGEDFDVTVTAKAEGMINIFHDGSLIAQDMSDEFTTNIIAGSTGKHWIKFIHQADGITTTDSIFYLVQESLNVEDLPEGVADGINIIDDNTVVFCLNAPWKNRVYVIGDFNNWQIEADYQLNRTPDGERWWIQIDDLEPDVEYRFQYLVDFEINIADPYSKKVLDPYNDTEIHPVIYPDLIDYPDGNVSQAVGVFMTTEEEYDWQAIDFEKPDNRDLIVYELLVRDWHIWHSYKTVMDSIEYLVDLGINAIELMPVNEFEGNDSWGYMPAFFFAPDKAYGTSMMLKEFVDVCHQNGIAVIMDLVLNHAGGQNPMARLYYNKEKMRPTWQNPWFNELIPHPYGYHNDFDHESQYTKNFVDSVLSFWIEEYHFDGYRLDLSKGFTNTVSVTYDEEGEINGTDVGGWGSYDVVRVDNIKRMADRVWERYPSTYMILEHLASFDEEKTLSDHGFMLWCGMAANEQYAQAAMGWTENVDFKYGVSYQNYQGSSLGRHNLVGYMESHDEERLVYKCMTYGNMNVVGNDTVYSTKDEETALERMGQVAAFFFTIPGPKMFWQFGERGYDYSINWPAVEEPGATRTDKKPPRWDYMEEGERQYLYKVYAALIKLRTSHNIFRTSNFEMSTGSYDKRIRLWDDGFVDAEMQVVVLGNFNVVSQSVWPEFSHDGEWYDYFTGDTIYIDGSMTEEQNFTFDFLPGEYHIYTDMAIDVPDFTLDTASNISVPGITGDLFSTTAYPNPFNSNFSLEFSVKQNTEVEVSILNSMGQLVNKETYNATAGRNKYDLVISDDNANGVYFYVIRTGQSTLSGKIIKK